MQIIHFAPSKLPRLIIAPVFPTACPFHPVSANPGLEDNCEIESLRK